jgi:hypothetical protein
MPFKQEARKRRSDRLEFMIPLHVSGVAKTGEAFECGGHAVAVNRFGAHIRLDRPVPVAEKVLLTNLENKLRGEFRIVRVLAGPSDEKTEFGVEALGNYPTFWGIAFPSRAGKPGESRGLLECCQCRSVTLHSLLLDEIELLESGGSVKKPCTSCRSRTEWKFAMQQGRASHSEQAAEGEDGPVKRTVIVQRPVSIRTASGAEETVQTENVQKDEIRCSSEKSYRVNQVVTLEWENSGTGQRLQVEGRIRRRQSIAGSPRVFYSIGYDGAPAVLPPAPLESARSFYVAMGALIAAASILLAINVRGLIFTLTNPSSFSSWTLASLGAALLLSALAYKAWRAVLAREPESRQMFRKRHFAATWLMSAVFAASLGVAAIDGAARSHQRVQARMVLHDAAVARVFEKDIDAAENRVTGSPADYADICTTLGLLAESWQAHLEALSADTQDFLRFQLWPDAKSRDEMKGLQEIIAIDLRKLRVVQQQAALEAETRNLSPDQQQAFWQSSFPPLRQQIVDLDAQENQVLQALMAKK